MTDVELREEALSFSKEDIATLTREEIKNYLRVLAVPYDDKDNTARLSRLLQTTVEKVKVTLGSDDDPMTTPVHLAGGKSKETSTGTSDPMLVIVQMLQQQMQQQEERFRREHEQRDRDLASILERVGLRALPEENPEDPLRRETAVRMSIRSPELLEDDTTLKTFKRWEASWKNYAQVAKLEKKSREDQVATFWMFCKPEFLQRIRHAMDIPMDTQLTLKEILEKIKCHLKDQRNIAVDRYKLVRRKQECGESFDDFLVDLREQAEDANLADMTADEWIATLIVSGVRNEETRQELLGKKPTLNLVDTITLCRNRELAEKEDKRLSGGSTVNANKLKVRARSKSRSRFKNGDNGNIKDKQKCRKCGFPSHSSGISCPAEGKTCHNCGYRGHYSRVCEKPKKDEKRKKDGIVTSSKYEGVKHIADISKSLGKRPMLPIDLYHPKKGYITSKCVVADTGAEVTVAGRRMMSDLMVKEEDLQKCEENLQSVNGKRLNVIGEIDLILKCNGKECTENIIFCNDVKCKDMYISLCACKLLGIVHEDFPLPLKSISVCGSVEEDTEKRPRSVDLSTSMMEEYSEVFKSKGHLKIMKTAPMKIELKEDAKPFAIYAARPVSYPLRDAVKKELDEMMEQDVIERVGDRPTEWCHPIVVVPKPAGGIRMTVDLTKLNSQVHRTVHNAKTPQDAVSEIVHGAKFFTVCDAVKGYWQLELHEDSRDLTTFLTPWGRFRYKRAPMGFISTGDSYNFRGDLAIDGLERTHKVVDDVLIASRTYEEHIRDVRAFLNRCAEHGITLNPKKFKFAQPSVKFAGYVLSAKGTEADPSKVKAIAEFATPTNITELRSFMGMVNQLASFSPHISATATPLRDLLKTRNNFLWLPEHDKAFAEMKKLLTNSPVLAQFDPSRETRVETDASKLRGLGFSLLQKHDEGWKLVTCESRFLADVETRYPVIELEALAIKYAITKCRLYLSGLPQFTVITDHRPLLPMFNKYSLNQVENAKLQNIKAELQSKFQFIVEWRKGKEHATADCLSRAPVDDPEQTEDDLHEERSIDPIVERLRESARRDPNYMKLVDAVKDDSVGHDDAPACVKQYKAIRHELAVDNDIVLYGQRLVIPREQRKFVLECLHTAHQGITRTKQRARMCVYWPGITNDLTQLVEKCEACQRHLPSLGKETLQADPLPSRPFESVSADLFYCKGRHFLIYVDRLSGYRMVHKWRDDPSSKQVVAAMVKMMAIMGNPQRMRTDGGPQFKALEFQKFLERKGIEWSPSSPHFPSSNGHAEAFVKKVKSLLMKLGNATLDEKFHETMLELRNTPRIDGRTPNQVVFGRRLRSVVPTHHSALMSETCEDIQGNALKKRKEHAEKVSLRYNASARDLEKFAVGDKVRIQNHVTKEWDKTGEVVMIGKRNRCYHIRLHPTGKLWWRNRRFLRKYHGDSENEELSGFEDPGQKELGLRRSERTRKTTVRFAM